MLIKNIYNIKKNLYSRINSLMLFFLQLIYMSYSYTTIKNFSLLLNW